jgi:hypothetical protein
MSVRFSVFSLMFMAAAGLVFGQDQVKIISVCELLANLNEYGNSAVAVVGRLDVTGVIYDRRNYVSQDQCESPVLTENYLWPNRILISTTPEKGLPSPPTDKPNLDRQLLAEKLASMKGKTILGLRNEFSGIDKNGQVVSTVVHNQWVVAYGHTFYSPRLTSGDSCKEIGCQGFAGKVPVIIMVDAKTVHTINEDGTFSDR